VESFSALAFWRSVSDALRSTASAAGSSTASLPAVVTLFERVYHAARYPSSYVLQSLSAARCSQQRSKWILSAIAAAAGAAGLWTLIKSGTLAWPQQLQQHSIPLTVGKVDAMQLRAPRAAAAAVSQ